jgi:hypothetical protein
MVQIISIELLQEIPGKSVDRDEFFASLHRLWDKVRDNDLKVTDVTISITDPKPFVRFKVAGELDWFEEKVDGMDEAEGIIKSVAPVVEG